MHTWEDGDLRSDPSGRHCLSTATCSVIEGIALRMDCSPRARNTLGRSEGSNYMHRDRPKFI